MLMIFGIWAFIILLPLVITLADEIITRWLYRHIPGPRQSWLLGNLRQVLRGGGMLPTLDRWTAQYGKIYQMRIMGRLFVVVSDPDAVRTLMFRFLNRTPPANPSVTMVAGELGALDVYGMLRAKAEYWRIIRSAWQPAFSPASLRGYQSLMDREALALVARLEGRLRGKREQDQEQEEAEGSKQAPDKALLTATGGSGGCATVEVLSEMSRTTLAVVGTVAFGVDFTSPEYGGSETTTGTAKSQPSAGGGEPSLLVQACSDFFRTMTHAQASKWALSAIIPRFLPLLRRLATTFPDKPLANHIKARRIIFDTAQRLIQGWRETHTDTHTHTHTKDPAKPAGPPVAAATKPAGVAPGSFLGLMLSARDKANGRGLSDIEVICQAMTFMLAGFETTANVLTFALYHLALSPEAADKLRKEVDRVVPPLVEGDGAGTAPLTVEVLEKLVYAEAVLQEAMRLHPPAHTTSRLTDKPIKVLGYDIPAGTAIFLPLHHMHHCEEFWPDAQAFRPERFLSPSAGAAANGNKAHTSADGDHDLLGATKPCGFGAAATDRNHPLAARHPHSYLPFGAGPRMCIGWKFAMQEAKTVLARLFQRFHFELVPGQVPLELSAGLTLAPKHGVVVRLTRRADC